MSTRDNTSTPDTSRTIRLAPTWGYAVSVYCAVLRNPDASQEAIAAACEDLQALAAIVDRRNEDSLAAQELEHA